MSIIQSGGHDLGPEGAVHGQLWGRMHGGYFSDPAVAQPLVEAVRRVWAKARADVMVDLGGGTGFLLAQLRAEGVGAEALLVNLDCSEAQLEVAGQAEALAVWGAVDGFRREGVAPAGRKVLWLMRSVLHYFGEAGLTPVLAHLRAQAEEGEFWVHQTACFEREADAACLNDLYRRLRTPKWYPTVGDLQQRLQATGWRVEDCLPAPGLPLASGELGSRYGLDKTEIRHIGAALSAELGQDTEVLSFLPSGFQAELHYRIFVCRAVSRSQLD